MWLIISFIFMVAGLISGNTDYWLVWGMMIIAHNIEWNGIQVKKLQSTKEQETNN